MKIWINDTELSLVVQGVTFQEELSNALDVVTIRSINYVQDEPFEPYSIIKILFDDNTFRFYLTQQDLVERHSKVVDCFIHTTICIEPTYLLSKIIMPSQAFTLKSIRYTDNYEVKERPTTMLDYINFALINAEPLVNGKNKRFILSDEIKELFKNVPSEDFFFDKPSLREVLDAMFATKDCRVKVLNTDFNHMLLGYKELNPHGELISFDNIVNYVKQSDATYNSDTVETNFTNAVDRTVIAKHGWDKLRPINGGIVTSDNYSFGNMLSIESIVRVQLRRNFVSSVPGGGEASADPRIATGTALIDATQYFIDEEIYKLLNAEEQKNYIPFTRGTGQFGSLFYKKLFFTYNKLESIFNKHLKPDTWSTAEISYLNPAWKDDYNWKNGTISYPDKATDIEYLIEYIPYLDSKAKLTCINNQRVGLSQLANAEEKNISLERYGTRFRNQVNQLGNNSYEVDVVCFNSAELKKLGDYTSDGYVISSIDYSISEKFIKVHYRLAKNFNNSSLKVSINREKRLYNIPLESITSHLQVSEKIKLSLTPGINSGNFINDAILNRYLKSFVQDNNGGIPKIAFKTTCMTDYLSIDVTEYPFGNSNCWHWQLLDNYSVELGAAKRVLGGRAIAYNPYVNELDGTIKPDSTPDSTDYDSYSYIDLVPINKLVNTTIKQSSIASYTFNDRSNWLKLRIYKDPYIKLAGTIQAEFLSDDDKIIVGPGIARHNNFNVDMTHSDNLLYLYTSTDLYTIRDNMAKGSRGALSVINSQDGALKVKLPTGNFSSWAIGTWDGKLLFAVNDKTVDTIYFSTAR